MAEVNNNRIVVDISSWKKLVSEAQFLRYQWFLLKAFVDNSPKSMLQYFITRKFLLIIV